MPRRRWLPYLLILPSVVFFALFFVNPLVRAILLAVQDGGAWTLDRFRQMGQDLYFPEAVRNTLALTAVVVPVQLVLALGLGLLLGALPRGGRDAFLYIWTIPLGVSDLAAGIAWLAIFTERGYLNSVLGALGLMEVPRLWLGYHDPVSLFVAVALAEVWRATAIVLVILVSGLQLIPRELGEAAEVFGASPWQRVRRVTLPLLRPSIQTALMLRTVLAFEVFAVVQTLAGRNLPVLASEAYTWYGSFRNPGVAASYGLVILGLSAATTLLYLQLLKVRPEARPS